MSLFAWPSWPWRPRPVPADIAQLIKLVETRCPTCRKPRIDCRCD